MKKKNIVQKTISFGGKKHKVKLSPIHEMVWYVPVSDVEGFEQIKVVQIQDKFFADYLGVSTNASTFEVAVMGLVATLQKHFKVLGEVLGYDVED